MHLTLQPFICSRWKTPKTAGVYFKSPCLTYALLFELKRSFILLHL